MVEVDKHVGQDKEVDRQRLGEMGETEKKRMRKRLNEITLLLRSF